MLSTNITACIFAFNEENRIRDAVLDLQQAFPILVIDNASIDNTAKIVHDMGVEVVCIRNPGYCETDSVMLPLQAAVHTDYILLCQVTEVIPFALLKEYARIANEGIIDVVRTFRISITNGQPIPLSGNPKISHPGESRFFRKGSVDFSKTKVHDRAKPLPGKKVIKLPQMEENFFYHFRDYDVSRTEWANQRYNDILGRQRFEEGVRFNWFQAIYQTLKAIFNPFLRFGVWRYGMLGFVHCLCWGWSEFSRWLRVWEWQTQNDMGNVLIRNNNQKQKYRKEVRNALNNNH